jgi:hypothetical protein
MGFWWESRRERDRLEDLGVCRRIILNPIFKKIGWEGVDWIDLAEDRDKWRTAMNTIMKLRVPQNGENYCNGFSRELVRLYFPL